MYGSSEKVYKFLKKTLSLFLVNTCLQHVLKPNQTSQWSIFAKIVNGL